MSSGTQFYLEILLCLVLTVLALSFLPTISIWSFSKFVDLLIDLLIIKDHTKEVRQIPEGEQE